MKLVRDLLEGRPHVTLPADASCLQSARVMTDHQVGAVLIVDEQNRPVGIFTERDLMVRVIVHGLDPATVPLSRVMTRELFCASPDQSATIAAQEMQARHVRHLPVVEQGRFVGMLSLRDLLREQLTVLSIEVEELTHYVHGDPPQ